MTAPTVFTAAQTIDIHLAASQAAVEAERERAILEDGFEAEHPILPATDEDSFRVGLQEHYRRVRHDVMAHLRDVYDFSIWFDAYALKQQNDNALEFSTSSEKDHVNGFTCSTGKGHTKTGVGATVDAMREAGEIGWKYSTVRKYRVLAGFEWKDIAKCGSLKKALEWCANEKRTPTEREERKERKATMRNRERLHLQEIHVLGCQVDEASKRIRELEEENRILRGAADPAEYKAMEECLESHAMSERMAYKKLDLSEALAHTYKSKLERQGRELGAARVALAARPPTNGDGRYLSTRVDDCNGAANGSTLLLGIGETRGVQHVDPGEQA